MRCSLLQLPPELLLQINREIVRHKQIEARASNDEKTTSCYASEEIDDGPIIICLDLIHWSSTCSYFRNLFVPNIFNTVKLVNDEKIGASLNAVAKSPHNVHVKELHFIGSPLGSAHKTGEVLARSVDTLLCDLNRFPSLERLSIRFDFDLMSLDWPENDADWENDTDSENEIDWEEKADEANALAVSAWRALMSATYSALTQNRSPHLKHLDIRQLIWENVPTFSHENFHEFLSHMEKFTLSIYGDNIERMSNTLDNYYNVMANLDIYFFDHLANVTTVSIKATNEGPLGLDGWPHVPLALEADQMPLLTTLHLEWIIICQELVDFLVGHKDTLEDLSLEHCYASPTCRVLLKGIADNRIYWSELFISMLSACPTKLRRLELVVGEMVWPSKQILDLLAQDPPRKFFGYANLRERDGELVYDMEQGSAAFLKGEDQASWDQLKELVERNAKRQSKDGQLQVQS